jgi:hypothetical protein
MKNKTKPNFFILGAPKCGTTAMSEYLRTHPDICFSQPKEPGFFNTDFSEEFRKCILKEDYLNSFSDFSKKIVADGTVNYLYSDVALDNILNFNPNSKFLVMLRNPVDVAYSMHSQLLSSAQEDIRNFKKAWELQHKRANDQNLPVGTLEPKNFQYGDFCKFGSQIKVLYRKVSEENIHVIIFDDFTKNTQEEHVKLLDFLGLENDHRQNFPKINISKKIHSLKFQHYIRYFSRKSYSPLSPIIEKLKGLLGINNLGLINMIRAMNEKKEKREPLDPEFRQELKDYFRADVELLSELLDRDLTHWVEPKSVNDSDR